MTYVISFEDYQPSQRHTSPATFWQTVTIQESSPDVAGEPTTWATIDALSVPTYTDQLEPPVFSFTTENGTQAPGWYRVVFSDAAGNEEFTQPIYYGGAYQFRPSTAEVAKLVPTRTRGDSMQDQDDFHENSRPTKEQVEALTVDAEAEVNNRLSSYSGAIPHKHHRKITYAMTLYAAMLVELTRYPEQIGTQRSAYDQIKKLYDEAMTQLEQALGIIPEGADTGTGAVVSGYGEPKYAFPEDRGGLVGWDTKF